MADLALARERLNEALATMRRRHSVLDKHLKNQDREVPKDWSEQATFGQNDEVLEALDDYALAEVEAIRAALHRVDHGSYGTCLKCGDDIPDGRLAAVPATATCTGCAS